MSEEPLEVRTYRSLDELETLRPNWNELLESYPLATTFCTPEWLIPWWRSFGNNFEQSSRESFGQNVGKDRQLLVVGFFDRTSRLVALAPLSLIRIRVAPAISLRLLRLMGDGSNDSDNLDLPVRPGFEDGFAASLLQYLKKQRGLWDFCELNTMPPRSPGADAFRQLLMRENWLVLENDRPGSAIPLPATWEEYLKHLSSKERGKIGLRTRRLEKKYDVRIRKCVEEGEIDRLLQALYELHGKHWQLRGLHGTLRSPARRQFYGEMASLLWKRNRLDLWVLELKGRIVAAQFGLRHGTTVFSLQEGYDPDYSADSVGYVLRSQVLKNLIADGIRRYDFLGGADESKLRWGAEPEHYLDLRLAPPSSPGAVYLRTLQYAARSKSWLRDNLPEAAWQILHKTNVAIRGKKAGATAAVTMNAPKAEDQSGE
jgi:CelD/BcsL family acetyltransferase involved in cellulose biosynthesis